jgi:hypothetical protein
MSQLAVNAVTDANGGNTATINSMTPTADSLQGFRNRIINGDCRIDQRNAGASVTPANLNVTLDRWKCGLTQTSKYSVQQNAGSVTPPDGFTNYIGVTSLSAYAITTTDIFNIQQRIEGFNISDFGWGTANAKTVTVSFWVRSSLTGTFGGSLANGAFNRSYPFTYAISVADTWEQKSVTIAGDTSGTWLTTNGVGLILIFGLGVGSTESGTAGAWSGSGFYSATGATSVVGTNAATWYITGVQLEVGSVATPFERRDYGRELMLCQRYYWKNTAGANNYQFGTGYTVTTTLYRSIIQFPVTMRTSPSALEQSGTAGDYKGYFANSATTCSAVPVFTSANQTGAITQFTVASGLTAGQAGEALATNATAYLAWSVEL